MEFVREGVRVGASPCGLGVFSLRPFRVDELIGPIRGKLMADPDYESDYCMEVGDHQAMEPAAPFRYLNHSCHPNCALVELEIRHPDGTPAGSRLWIETLTEIAAGQQMTIDYAWPAARATPCECGCPECRGWIVAADQRDRLDPGRRQSC